MNILNAEDLDLAIIGLERQKIVQHHELMKKYRETAESLHPGNLAKEAFEKIIHSTDARSGILKTITGLGVGILTKKLLLGHSGSFLQKVLGSAVKLGVAKTAISNTDKIKAYAMSIYHNVFQKK